MKKIYGGIYLDLRRQNVTINQQVATTSHCRTECPREKPNRISWIRLAVSLGLGLAGLLLKLVIG